MVWDKFDEKAKGWVKINNWQDLKVIGMTDIAFSAGPPSNLYKNNIK